MGNEQSQATVETSLQQAISVGLDRTPSLLINDQRMADPFDYAALKAEIDRLSSEQ
jgi:hypothetical protein